jgi:hypothetical protein
MTDPRVNRMNQAARCHATSKRTGMPCQAPAMRGWRVCRFHGARGGAPKGAAHGRFKHGKFTCEAVQQRRVLSALVRAANEQLASI